jgi:hypothetical protein
MTTGMMEIRFEDLDPEVQQKLAGSVKVQLTLTTPFSAETSNSFEVEVIKLSPPTRSIM